MVFSFFRKGKGDKRRPDAKSRTASGRSTTGAAGRTTRGSADSTLAAERERTRMRQAETAAKIDRIESEMDRSLATVLAKQKRPATAATAPTPPRPSAAAPEAPSLVRAPAPTPSGPTAAEPDQFDADDQWAAARATRHTGVEDIEINTLSSGSVIDEAAILFANGQADAAEAALRAAVTTGDVGAQLPLAYRMLLELVAQRGDRVAFEASGAEFNARCGGAVPAWFTYGHVDTVAGAPAVVLPAVVDAGVVKALEQLKALTAKHPVLLLDSSAMERIDAVGAQLLLRVIQAFKRSALEMAIVGIERLEAALRGAIAPGRRDASDAPWMLLFEVLRLRDRQQEFDELGLQYCVTFEVSPPSWEPAPRNLSVRAASVPAAQEDAGGDLQWRDELDSEAERAFAVLVEQALKARRLSVDCLQLRRIGFGAASSLLAHLLNLRDAGVPIVFQRVNPLVAALFDVLGIGAVATVQPRPDHV